MARERGMATAPGLLEDPPMSRETTGGAAVRRRARELGIPFEGAPGPLNAITDVAGVAVGFTTLISGEGRLEVGKGPVRTGVSAILPRTTGRPGVRRLVRAERQRRDDRHDLGRGVRVRRRPDHDHQHPQRRHRARCRGRVAEPAPPARGGERGLAAAGGRGDLGRLPERRQRPSRHQGARVRGARSGRGPDRSPRATSAAARA